MTWRWAKLEGREICEVWDKAREAWRPRPAWAGEIWAGLDAGDSYQDILGRLHGRHGHEQTAAQLDRLLRGHLLRLQHGGTVDLNFPPAPDAFGPFVVEAELGRGGVGIAWRCRHQESGERVVVKQPWAYHQPLEVCDAEVRWEAEVLAALDHPSVPRLRAVVEADGLGCLVRDLVPGEPAFGPLDASDVARLAGGILDILEHLHGRGFLLLDVRPDNFLLPGDGQPPILLDAGLCRRHAGGAVQLPKPIGTPGYAAPETVRDAVVSVQSDLFSLGRTLHCLLVGRHPRHAWGEADLARATPEGPLKQAIVALCRDDPAARPADLAAARALLPSP